MRHNVNSSSAPSEVKKAAQAYRVKLFIAVLLVILILPVVWVSGYSLWILASGAFQNVKEETLSSGNLKKIGAEINGVEDVTTDTLNALSSVDPFLLRVDSSVIGRIPLESPDSGLVVASGQWVSLVNQANPEAILKHDIDEFGNIYLYPGYWWYTLSIQDQRDALDSLGRYWRSFLVSLYGPWDSQNTLRQSDKFAPGIIMLDHKGEVGRNINGYIRITRKAEL